MKKKNKPIRPVEPASRTTAGARRAVTEILHRLRPPEEARRHFQNARLEVLKGLRALIDARIERRSAGPSRGQQISVE